MIHLAVGLVVLSLTCAALVLASESIPSAPGVDGVFVTGTCAALVPSGVVLWYVQRTRS